MSKQCSYGTVRYVLVTRDAKLKRLAVCSTSRSLVDLAGLLKSLFAHHAAAVHIDVVLPGWPAGQTVDDQEVMVSADRCSGDGPGLFVWYKVRDLRAIEKDIEARAAELVPCNSPAPVQGLREGEETQREEARV